MSARRLLILIQQLPVTSATAKAVNGGRVPFSQESHLLADLWALKANTGREKHELIDHPVRAAMQAKQQAEEKLARVVDLRSTYRERKQRYGLG